MSLAHLPPPCLPWRVPVEHRDQFEVIHQDGKSVARLVTPSGVVGFVDTTLDPLAIERFETSLEDLIDRDSTTNAGATGPAAEEV